MSEQGKETINVIVTGDGSHTLLSNIFSDTYHSTHGALSESQHIYIEHGLHHIWQSLQEVHIIEFGFGTGLNAGLTFRVSLANPGKRIRYHTLEAHPLPLQVVSKLQYSDILDLPGFELFHQLPWNQPHQLSNDFTFQKSQMRFEDFAEINRYDLIYYDAFSPGSQPGLWDVGMLSHVVRAMKTPSYLVTYCAQGAFRRTLQQLGLEVHRLPGPPGKREMIRAVKRTSPND